MLVLYNMLTQKLVIQHYIVRIHQTVRQRQLASCQAP